MTSSVILKKKNSSDNFGYVSIRYFNGNGKKKVISLAIRMDEDLYNNNYDPNFSLFKKTITDYKTYNKKINEKINDFSVFDEVKEIKSKSFLVFFKDYLKLINNPSTYSNYNAVLKKLIDFANYKEKTDIMFEDVNYKFAVELKNYFSQKMAGTSGNQYLIIVRTILNIAMKEELYHEKFNYFSKLKIDEIYNNKKILSKKDVNKLFTITSTIDGEPNKHYYFRNMLLFSMFANGIRVSDMLLCRNRDFKKEYLEMLTKKTSKSLRIAYNEKLVTILLNIYNIHEAKLFNFELHYYNRAINKHVNERQNTFENRKKSNEIMGNKKAVLEFIATLPPNDFVFSEFLTKEPSLYTYDKSKEMSTEQNDALNRLRVNFNFHLNQLRKQYKLDIEKISSHTARYSWTNLLIGIEGVSLLDISRSLGHKNLSITEGYIEKNFGSEILNNIGTKLADQFIIE
jgi:integrase